MMFQPVLHYEVQKLFSARTGPEEFAFENVLEGFCNQCWRGGRSVFIQEGRIPDVMGLEMRRLLFWSLWARFRNALSGHPEASSTADRRTEIYNSRIGKHNLLIPSIVARGSLSSPKTE
jgi:hypothetical protein